MWKNIFVTFLAVSATMAKPQPLGAINLVPLGVTLPSVTTPVPILASVPQLGPGTSGLTTPLSALDINKLSLYIVTQLGLSVPTSLVGIVALISQIMYIVDYGVTVNFINGQLTLGGVSLPSYITCRTAGTSLAACIICNYDCVYVHNTYGGSCAIDNSTPLTPTNGTKGYDCVCQDDRNANGTITPVEDVCGSIAGPEFDPIVNLAVKQFLLIREQAELCQATGNDSNGSPTYISSGCQVDCARNHQYSNGTCEYVNTIPFTPDQTTTTANGLSTYCICNDD